MEAPYSRKRNHSRILPLLLIYTVLLLSGVKGYNESPLSGPEHQLYLDLFASYNHESRPVKNASHAVTVTFALALNQLLDLDEKNQVLTTSVWIYEEWQDETLKWSPSKYEGQSALMIPASNIWLPDIFIFNTAGPNMNGFVNVNGSKVSIQHDGNVKWMVPLMVASACAVDVTYFPYDRQTCEIKFGSWIYDIDQLDILIDTDKPDLEHYVMNSEYDLENVSIHRGVLDSSCCPGDGRHPMVKLTIKLRRKSLYYDYIVIAPTIMLCVMTLASFLLPCDRGEKMNIGLTVFLTLYVLQLRIADNVPDTNSTPILGVFMLVVMTFNCVSLIMATIVMNIKKLGDGYPCPDVPRWLFALCRHILGRAVCTPYIWSGDPSYGIPLKAKKRCQREPNSKLKINSFDQDSTVPMVNDRTPLTNVTKASLSTEEQINLQERKQKWPKNTIDNKEEANCLEGQNNFCGKMSQNNFEKSKTCEILKNPDRKPNQVVSASSKDNTGNLQNKDIADHYGMRLRRRSRQSGRNETTEANSFWPLYDKDCHLGNQSSVGNDHTTKGFILKKRWFYVAEVVDKFLFVVYLVLLTCSIFTVLFLIPVYFRTDS